MLEKLHYEDDKLHIERVEDVEPVLEANKRAYNDAGAFKSEVFNKKASIPLTILLSWCQSKGITYHEFMNDDSILRRFLNDPDNRFCLTRPGKV